ncbi:MAG: site-specific DNA-methyltransferase [Gammaproteobacteria bacterium]|nr:site-specific DNA-methyltransferase [Gammaproteobacteria bacterium]
MAEDKRQLIQDKDPREEKIQLLQESFPGVVEKDEETGGYNLNADKLQQILDPSKTKIVEDGYELRWVGKKVAYNDAYKPNRKLLRPLYKDSKRFEDTSNILIKGDNLDALKILHRNYSNKIKMIYIDPPYNTQEDEFVYKDNFLDREEDVLEKLNYKNDDVEYIKNILETRSHSSWLTFIYPRLLLAKDLMEDEGIIFISIDDREQPQLRIICDEIFGSNNFVANLVWHSNKNIMKASSHIRKDHEYIIAYKKSSALPKIRIANEGLQFSNPDNDPKGEWINTNATYTYGENKFAIKLPNGKSCTRNWRFNEEDYKAGKIPLIFKGGNVPRLKVYKSQYNINNKTVSSLILDIATTTTGNNDLAKVISCEAKNIPFSNPKDSALIKYLLKIGSAKDSIVLDFFAGSGTTAQAVMELNEEDGGNRKFMLVQLDEEISESHHGAVEFIDLIKKPASIFEICAERIRKAGEGIKNKAVDTGFKIFEIIDDDANRIYDVPLNEIKQAELLKPENNEVDDLLYSLMAADGIALDEKVNCINEDSLFIVYNTAYVFAEVELSEIKNIKENYPMVEYLSVYSPNIESDDFMLQFQDYALTIGFEKSKIKIIA